MPAAKRVELCRKSRRFIVLPVGPWYMGQVWLAAEAVPLARFELRSNDPTSQNRDVGHPFLKN